jgi:predicted ATPase
LALWLLGYPEAASAEIEHACKAARETAHAPTLLFALSMTTFPQICCRNYTRANAQIDECIALAEEKSTANWKIQAMAHRGCVLALVGKSSEAIQTISAGIDGWRSIGAKVFATFWLSHLALSYAEIGEFDKAWRVIDETMTAMETTKEKWCEAEVNRIAGEVARQSSEGDVGKAEGYFERALTVARQQQAKSWELRAAMSLARLWRDQGKVQQALNC